MNGPNRITKYLLVAVLCTLGTCVVAQQAAVSGQWSGLAQASSGGMRVYLEARFSGRRVVLHFDEPYNCRIEASLFDADSNTSHFKFKTSTNGGRFCDNLYPGEFTTTRSSAGELVVTFKSGGDAWKGSLKADTRH